MNSSHATLEFLNVAASTQRASAGAFAHLLDLAGSPLFCEERFERAVEAEDHEPARPTSS